jgi:type II secretory pathway pseudopilin PulG
MCVSAKRERRAFTLVEILGVVVILGLISAVILPQLGSRDDQKAAAAARVLMADLTYAQNRAITKQKTHYVLFDATNNYYRVLESMSPVTMIKNPVDGSNYQVVFGSSATNGLKDMKLQTANFDTRTVLAFDAMGVPHSYDFNTATIIPLVSGQVIVKCGTHQLRVTVAPFSGELTVQ